MNAEERGFDPETSKSEGLSAPSSLVRVLFLAFIATSFASCSPHPTPTLFIPPTAEAASPTSLATAASTVSPTRTPIPSPTATAAAASSTPCTNDLSFVQDVTVPDGTSVTPGERVDKQWLVANSGSCNWDASYRLKLISGDAMDAPPEQALYPARAGTQATLRIVFTAPQTTGNYASAWQAVAPDGTTFGQAVTLQINVTP